MNNIHYVNTEKFERIAQEPRNDVSTFLVLGDGSKIQIWDQCRKNTGGNRFSSPSKVIMSLFMRFRLC